MSHLPDDVLYTVLSLSYKDYTTLYQCALVDGQWNNAASKFLYQDVVLKLSFSLTSNETLKRSNIMSATLPRYAGFVESIRVIGSWSYLGIQNNPLSPGPNPNPNPSFDMDMSNLILQSIKSFSNLQTVILTPDTRCDINFSDILEYLALGNSKSNSGFRSGSGLGCHQCQRQCQCQSQSRARDEAQIRVEPESLSELEPQEEANRSETEIKQNQHEPRNPTPTPTPTLHIHKLVINPTCSNEMYSPLLTQIVGLSSLTIEHPTRAVLNLLPDWIFRLSGSGSDLIRELHLKGDCGSVTPNILKTIKPYISKTIQKLTFGLSYSITDDDLFGFLNGMERLEELDVRYYWLRTPRIKPTGLKRLSSFVIRYDYETTMGRNQIIKSCKFIRQVIGYSSIRKLAIICDGHSSFSDFDDDDGGNVNGDFDNDDDDENLGPKPNYKSLIDHLCSKHSETLKVLDIQDCYVGVKGFGKLVDRCRLLEDVRVSVRVDVLKHLQNRGTKTNLTSLSFKFCNIRIERKKRRVLRNVNSSLSEFITIFNPNPNITLNLNHNHYSMNLNFGQRELHRLILNGHCWELKWELSKDNEWILIPYKFKRSIAPWNRKPKFEPKSNANQIDEQVEEYDDGDEIPDIIHNLPLPGPLQIGLQQPSRFILMSSRLPELQEEEGEGEHGETRGVGECLPILPVMAMTTTTSTQTQSGPGTRHIRFA